jgi:adenylyltransferase/sulfurtransferase
VGAGSEKSVASANETPEITPAELAERLRRGDDIDLIDVREPYELNIARIPNVRLIPLGTLGDAIPSLDPERETVVICRTGARSGRAVQQLRAAGFEHVYNLVGGIHRWADEVDPSLPKY